MTLKTNLKEMNMSKRFSVPFQKKSAALQPPAPRPWQAMLTVDPASPDATQLQFLSDAQPRLDDVIVALGKLRDAALSQRGAMLMQQQLAAQQEQAAQSAKSGKPSMPKE